MSEKCPKNCPEGPKTQFSGIFWTIFAYLVDAFVWWPCPMLARYNLSGTGDSQRDSRESIRANQFARIIRNWQPYFIARIVRIGLRESRH